MVKQGDNRSRVREYERFLERNNVAILFQVLNYYVQHETGKNVVVQNIWFQIVNYGIIISTLRVLNI
jgi:hypothetical protein